MNRSFSDAPAVRERTPLLVGIVSPSGAGKTKSALRLATGMRRVVGGEIFVIDTEARRALHYATEHEFRHVEFLPPFSPLDYLSAVQHCLARGAKVIVIDSQSHEHEGQGGLLDWHSSELDRMAGSDEKARNRANFGAWRKPKAAHSAYLQGMIQAPCNFIFCFRAKEKIQVQGGSQPPIQLGWQPIASDDFVYEMTVRLLLLPGADGVPTWNSPNPAEAAVPKCPEALRPLFAKRQQLNEDIGEQLATWAAGSGVRAQELTEAERLIARYGRVTRPDELSELESDRKAAWSRCSPADKRALKAAAETAAQVLQRKISAAKAAVLEGYRSPASTQEDLAILDEDRDLAVSWMAEDERRVIDEARAAMVARLAALDPSRTGAHPGDQEGK